MVETFNYGAFRSLIGDARLSVSSPEAITSDPMRKFALVVTRQRFSPFSGDYVRSFIFYLASSFRAYCSYFNARESDLSTVGRFLTSSVAVMLSSLGSLSLPLLESPSPSLIKSLSF